MGSRLRLRPGEPAPEIEAEELFGLEHRLAIAVPAAVEDLVGLAILPPRPAGARQHDENHFQLVPPLAEFGDLVQCVGNERRIGGATFDGCFQACNDVRHGNSCKELLSTKTKEEKKPPNPSIRLATASNHYAEHFSMSTLPHDTKSAANVHEMGPPVKFNTVKSER